MELFTQIEVCIRVCRSIASSWCECTSMLRMYSKCHCTTEQEECQSSKLRICRFSQYSHECVMISLTPCFKPTIDRQVAFGEYAEFKDADDMIQKLNEILSRPTGFPSIPAPRKDCQSMTFGPDKGIISMSCVQSRIARALSNIATRTEDDRCTWSRSRALLGG